MLFCYFIFFISIIFFSFVMEIEILMVISGKKRNNYLTWTYGKFILSGERELCFACALKKTNDGTLAICSKLLYT